MASTIGVVVILLGGFVMAVGYGTVLQCLGMFPNEPFCWDPWTFGGAGSFVFYLGAAIITLGTIILAGPKIASHWGSGRVRDPTRNSVAVI